MDPEGDIRFELLCGETARAGDSDFPLPSTLPPPSFLDDMFHGFETPLQGNSGGSHRRMMYVAGGVLMSADLILDRFFLSSSHAFLQALCNVDDYTTLIMAESFPEVQGGGSLILAWQIRNKRVLIVGGGEVCDLFNPMTAFFRSKLTETQVAAGRILNVLNADANVTVVSPRDGLNPEVAYRVENRQVDYVDRKFEPSDLDGVDMVLTAVDDPEASTQIWKLCKERKIAANIADVPPECDFYFGSVHRDGPLQVMVSTNGNGPKLASIVRKQIAAKLPSNIGAAIQKVGTLRQKLRKVAPGNEEGPKRMQWYVRTIGMT